MAGRGLLLLLSAAALLLPGTAMEGLAGGGAGSGAWERIPPHQSGRRTLRTSGMLRLGSGLGAEVQELLRGLRGGVGADEMRESAAKVGRREGLRGGDPPEFAVEGGVLKFRLCGESHEMPLAEVDMPLVRGDTVTALLLASAEGRAEVVEGLIQAGASITKATEDGDTPAHLAAYHGHVGVLQALLEAGGTGCLMAVNVHGATPLHCAASSGSMEAACWLLSKGCDSGARDFKDCLPEDMAQAEGHLDLASVLKERRAKTGLQGLTMS